MLGFHAPADDNEFFNKGERISLAYYFLRILLTLLWPVEEAFQLLLICKEHCHQCPIFMQSGNIRRASDADLNFALVPDGTQTSTLLFAP